MEHKITKQKLEKYYKLTSKALDEVKKHIVKRLGLAGGSYLIKKDTEAQLLTDFNIAIFLRFNINLDQFFYFVKLC